MATLSSVLSQFRILINETDTANSHFTDTELTEYVNQAQTFLAAMCEHPRTFVSAQVTDGTADYTLPTNAISILTSYFGDTAIANDVRPIRVISEETLKELHPDWLDAGSASKGRPKFVILKSKTTITLYPRPNSDEGAVGKKYHLNYIKVPAALSAASDTPDLPVPYHDLLQFYAAHLAYLRLQLNEMSDKMMSLFLSKVKALQYEVTKESKEGMQWQWGFDPGLGSDDGGIAF